MNNYDNLVFENEIPNEYLDNIQFDKEIADLNDFAKAWNNESFSGLNRWLCHSIGRASVYNEFFIQRVFEENNQEELKKANGSKFALRFLLFLMIAYHYDYFSLDDEIVIIYDRTNKRFIYSKHILYSDVCQDEADIEGLSEEVIAYLASKEHYNDGSEAIHAYFSDLEWEFNRGCKYDLYRDYTFTKYGCHIAVSEGLISQELLDVEGIVDKDALAKHILNPDMYKDTSYGLLVDTSI